MDAYELIMNKRNGNELSEPELEFLVSGFTDGEIPDYQMAAFLMATWFRGMNPRERAQFTQKMVDTGETLEYPRVSGTLVDKHSTGGVGDGVSLALVPLVGSFGVKIPMMSGRGLGHTGGTLDKLESIPGFRVQFGQEEIQDVLNEVGGLIMSQTGEVAPADQKMYALRDVTATVDSVDLIAASIMSKKIAEGMDALILDVKTGSGAFMVEYEDSLELARAMVDIGRNLDKEIAALVTDMDQPLGRAVGNALEMKQAIEILHDQGPPDLTALICRLGAEMLRFAGVEEDTDRAYDRLRDRLGDEEVLEYARRMIDRQDGEPGVVDDPGLLPVSDASTDVSSSSEGYVQAIDAFQIGLAAKSLGAGRDTMEDELDYGAGLELEKKVGSRVEAEETLVRLRHEESVSPDTARDRVRRAVQIGPEPPEPRPFIVSRVDREGTETRLDRDRPEGELS